MKAKIITVKVFKDMVSEIFVSVPEFELPLLQAANGCEVGDDEGPVSPVSDDGVFEYSDERTMFDAMQRKYGESVVATAYQSLAGFTKALKEKDSALSKPKAKSEA